MFRIANKASRIPSWLQPYTLENFVWQLSLTAVLLGGMWAKDYYDERQLKKQLQQTLAD